MTRTISARPGWARTTSGTMARAVGLAGAAIESSRSRITASAAEAIALVIFRSESPGANRGLRKRMG